ncbi:MAG: hypothetical protein JWM37_311 [Candidatus Saccharibacteria bacterium]|nr:hypothetical protein [Candidatus Saccharibacteria bacterium]
MAELLGVTGFQCSGKDTVANILRDFHGFEPVTSSDVIRDHIKANNLGEPTRPLLTAVARELRASDASAIIQASLMRCESDRVIISGLYSKAEAEYFAGEAGGKIIKCDAAQRLRYERALSRGRVGDDVDLATFQSWESGESISTSSSNQSIIEVGRLAIATIINEGTYDDLRASVEATLIGLEIDPYV